jgi:hypothetical protein
LRETLGAQALSQAQIDALTRDTAARFGFASKLQGCWTCGGLAADGKARKASIVLFTVTPGVYEFELTPTPASPAWSNIVETTWKWRWSYGTYGRWFATADSRTAGAGVQFVSGGWSGTRLEWKQFVSPSTITRTFELTADGSLAFTVRDTGNSEGSGGDYHLLCRRSPGPLRAISSSPSSSAKTARTGMTSEGNALDVSVWLSSR